MDATHKALILDLLAAGPQSGRSLREQIYHPGEEPRSKRFAWLGVGLREVSESVAFYADMARLEDEGAVEGYWVDGEIGGVATRARWFRLPAAGLPEAEPMAERTDARVDEERGNG